MDTEHIAEELKEQADICKLAGCTTGYATEAMLERKFNELHACINSIKANMQTKSHYIWEIVKLVGIPIITVLLIWWGLLSEIRTKVTYLDELTKRLDVLVIELIKNKQ